MLRNPSEIGIPQRRRCILCRQVLFETAEDLPFDTRNQLNICKKCQTP